MRKQCLPGRLSLRPGIEASMYHAKPRFHAALHIREVAGEGG